MAVTIRQIAEAAGVSRGTVDRVVNNRGHVNPQTELTVRLMIEKLGYRPDMAGKALAAKKKSFVIGMILCSEGNEFFDDVLKGVSSAEREGAAYGMQVIVKTMKGYSVERQLALMDEMGWESNLLILSAINDKRIAQRINRLADKGVGVITVNTDVEDSRRLCHIGSNFFRSGEIACGILGLLSKGAANVGIATGSVMILGHNQRISGFNAARKVSFPGIHIADIVETNDDEETGYREMKKMLVKHPEINAVYVAAAGAAGVCRAVKEEREHNMPVIVTSDSTPSIKKLIREGTVQATVCQQPYTQGYRAVKTAMSYLIHGELQAKEIYAVKNEIKILQNI